MLLRFGQLSAIYQDFANPDTALLEQTGKCLQNGCAKIWYLMVRIDHASSSITTTLAKPDGANPAGGRHKCVTTGDGYTYTSAFFYTTERSGAEAKLPYPMYALSATANAYIHTSSKRRLFFSTPCTHGASLFLSMATTTRNNARTTRRRLRKRFALIMSAFASLLSCAFEGFALPVRHGSVRARRFSQSWSRSLERCGADICGNTGISGGPERGPPFSEFPTRRNGSFAKSHAQESGIGMFNFRLHSIRGTKMRRCNGSSTCSLYSR